MGVSRLAGWPALSALWQASRIGDHEYRENSGQRRGARKCVSKSSNVLDRLSNCCKPPKPHPISIQSVADDGRKLQVTQVGASDARYDCVTHEFAKTN